MAMYNITREELKQLVSEAVREAVREAFKEASDKEILEKVFHFSQIPDEAKKRQYVYYSAMLSVAGFGGPFMMIEDKLIAEEATYTISVPETKKIMMQKFNLDAWQIGMQQGANGVELMFYVPDISNNVDLVVEAMESCGWFLSRTKEVVDKGKKWKILSFDPIFQDDVSYEARTEKVLYHWTPEYRYVRIKEEGLFPKSENDVFKYPNRLHLAKGSLSDGQILNLGRQLYNANKEKANNGRYILLKIDVSRLPMGIEFYFDPRYDGGYYVKDPIPSYAIVSARGYDFKQNKPFEIR